MKTVVMSENSPKFQIWISPHDKTGKAVDPHLIEIGHKVFPGVMRFAQQLGLPDTTRVPEIVEKVVHAASRKNSSASLVEKSPQYLYAACKYKIYHLAEREGLSERTSVEDFDAGIDLRSLDWEPSIHRRLRLEEAFSDVHGKHRDLLILFSQSYPREHIG